MSAIKCIGILRGIEEKHIEPVIRIASECGLNEIEVTMNTPNVLHLIHKMKKLVPKEMKVGAGTVTTMKELIEALNAGAQFIVTPVVRSNIIIECKNSKIPIYPGALTPTEVYHAWHQGATMVKVFPASVFGPKYFRELKGPFNKIKLMAVGGVTADNVSEYIKNGADAIAVGGSVFNLDLLNKEDYETIKERLGKIINNINTDIS